MGYDNENAQRLVFDIETAPLPDAADYLEAESAPSNYKDPLKIAAYIEEAKQGALAKCALDVDLCRIVAVGWWLEGADGVTTMTARTDAYDETSLLSMFWGVATGRYLIGFNCLGFDLPVLLRRSLYLGVSVPDIQIDKYKRPRVSDLMDVLSFQGKLKMRSLAFYCRRFGIDVPDGLKGADIGQAVTEGRWEAVEAHVRADVQKTAMLAARLSLFQLPAEVL